MIESLDSQVIYNMPIPVTLKNMSGQFLACSKLFLDKAGFNKIDHFLGQSVESSHCELSELSSRIKPIDKIAMSGKDQKMLIMFKGKDFKSNIWYSDKKLIHDSKTGNNYMLCSSKPIYIDILKMYSQLFFGKNEANSNSGAVFHFGNYLEDIILTNQEQMLIHFWLRSISDEKICLVLKYSPKEYKLVSKRFLEKLGCSTKDDFFDLAEKKDWYYTLPIAMQHLFDKHLKNEI